MPDQDSNEKREEFEIKRDNYAGTVRLTYSNQYISRLLYHEMFRQSQKQNQDWGLQSPSDYDEYKRVWLETNFYLFALTMVVSVLHSLFECLAFKNDIQFWNSKEDMEGISVKSLYLNIGMQVVVTMYLFDNETSLLVLGP